MAERSPPVPPASRGKRPGQQEKPPKETGPDRSSPRDTAKQGRQGNVAQNTRNQGYQQDR